MLGLLGVNYLIDSILAAISEHQKMEHYRVYVTDCLYTLCAWAGNPLSRRYYDILHPNADEKKTGDEIARDRLERFGIEVVD